MKLEWFGTLSDPKGVIKIASMFALGENHGKQLNKQCLTGLGYRIAGMNGIDLKHVFCLYAMRGHANFCKLMLMVCGTLMGDDTNEFLQ
jgi:hypothetical protein